MDTPDEINVSDAAPVHKLNAKTVIELIKKEGASSIQPEQIVEVEGIVKEINYLNNRISILLGSENVANAFVICDMQRDQDMAIAEINLNDTVRLKGVFKGFLEDAIFLNCIISKSNYE